MRPFLSAVALLLALGLAHAEDPKNTLPKKDKPADPKEDKLVAGKQAFASKDGKYSVEFPYTKKLTDVTQDIPVGDVKVKLYMTMLESGNVAYLVGYCDYPADLVKTADVDDLLDGVMGGVLQGKKEKETKKIKIQGQKAREASFEVPELKVHGKARAVLVGNRLYQIIALEPDAKATGIDTFLQSLVIADLPKDKKEEKKEDKPVEKKDGKLEGGKQTFTSKGGKYSVEFPYTNKPKEFTQDIKGGLDTAKMYMVMIESDSVAYLSAHMDLPDGTVANADLDALLDNGVANLIGGMKAKEKETKKVKVEGVPALEVTFELPELKAHGKARIFFIGDRLYQVIAIEPDAKAAGLDKFITSFKLTDAKKKDDK